ncbi:MAG: hypothetical protein MJ199_01140 [Bacilli bacterium]|nr:hypothetical protein [Bacilli bacterium]
MKKHEFYYTYRPMNRYGELFGNEIKILDVSFNNKKDALNFLREHGDVLVKSVYAQFKDQWDYVREFTLYLYKDNKVVKTLTIKENKK